PPQHSLAPGVHETEREQDDEHRHLDDAERAERFEPNRPREDEHGFDVEDDEQQRVDVVAEVRLSPSTDGVGAGFVGDELLGLWTRGAEQPADAEHRPHHQQRGADQDGHREVLPIEVGHVHELSGPPRVPGPPCSRSICERLAEATNGVPRARCAGSGARRSWGPPGGAMTSITRIGRPDRQKGTPWTAFVLSGGGNYGVSQVGMLRALIERGILPDVVIGTSAGALNGAAVATSPTIEKIDHLERCWVSLEGDQVFPAGALRRAWNVLRRDDHLIPNHGLAKVIEMAELAPTFAQLEVPLRVVTTDLITGDEILIVSGPTAPALLASAALPGIFPPVHLNGHILVDGAVVNLVPISHAAAGPMERVFVLDVSDPIGEKRIRSPLDVVVRAFAISRDLRFELELQWMPKDIEMVILPAPEDDRDFIDFSNAKHYIDSAHDMAAATLDDLEQRP